MKLDFWDDVLGKGISVGATWFNYMILHELWPYVVVGFEFTKSMILPFLDSSYNSSDPMCKCMNM